jgi:hypothetical protein
MRIVPCGRRHGISDTVIVAASAYGDADGSLPISTGVGGNVIFRSIFRGRRAMKKPPFGFFDGLNNVHDEFNS